MRPATSTRATASASSVTNVSIVPEPSGFIVTVMSASTLQPARTSRQTTATAARFSIDTTLHHRRIGRGTDPEHDELA